MPEKPQTKTYYEKLIQENEAALAALTEREDAIRTERKRLSLDAVTGDSEARAALDKINEEALTLPAMKENIRALIEAAQVKIGEIDRSEMVAAMEKRHEEARRLNETADALGKRIDAIASELAAALGEMAGIRDRQKRLVTVRARIDPGPTRALAAFEVIGLSPALQLPRSGMTRQQKKSFAELAQEANNFVLGSIDVELAEAGEPVAVAAE